MKKVFGVLAVLLCFLLLVATFAFPFWNDNRLAVKERSEAIVAAQEFTVEGQLLATVHYSLEGIETKGEFNQTFIELVNQQIPSYNDAGQRLITYCYIAGQESSSQQEILLAKQNLKPCQNSIMIFLANSEGKTNCYLIIDNYWSSNMPAIMGMFMKPNTGPLTETFTALMIGATIKIPSTVLLTGGWIPNNLVYFSDEQIPYLTS